MPNYEVHLICFGLVYPTVLKAIRIPKIEMNRKNHERCGQTLTIAPSVTLKELLVTTLNDVEKSTNLNDDDPALVELKHSLVRSVAELDLKREQRPQSDADGSPAANNTRPPTSS